MPLSLNIEGINEDYEKNSVKNEMIPLIESFFKIDEEFITDNNEEYDIHEEAIECYEKLINNTPQSTKSIRSDDSGNTGNTTKESFFTNEKEYKDSEYKDSEYEHSIKTLEEYTNQNAIERKTPNNEREQQIFVGNIYENYTIQYTYYLSDKTNKNFYKMYMFKTTDNYAFLSILREIVLHKYALFLKKQIRNNHKYT
jgi:hypothetical protein